MATVKVLFLAANPRATTALSLDEESREIGSKIRAADHRDAVEFLTKWAVRPDDLLQYLNQHKPHIVHFSGHGSPSEQIILAGADGQPRAVSKEALVSLFTTLKDNIRVVLFNACYSRSQAEAIREFIDCSIGMNQAIGDRAAITFAASFYRAVGFGRSVQEAFDQGKTALLLEGIPEEHTPELLARTGVDPSRIVLLDPREPVTVAAAGSGSSAAERRPTVPTPASPPPALHTGLLDATDSPRSATTYPTPVDAPRGGLMRFATNRWLILGLATTTLVAVTVAAFHGTFNDGGGPVVIAVGAEPSTDRDQATVLTFNEIRANFVKKEKTRYYFQFTAGPGELKTTLDVTAAASSREQSFLVYPDDYQCVTVTLFDEDAKTLGDPLSIEVAGKANKRVVKRCQLERQQPVILEIETRSRNIIGGNYLVRLEGEAWRP
jgi:hypothetical protein